MLRQVIMCNADVGVITHRWVQGHSRPYPNFNVNHQCRDFDKLQEWAKEQGVPTPDHYVFKPEANDRIFSSVP